MSVSPCEGAGGEGSMEGVGGAQSSYYHSFGGEDSMYDSGGELEDMVGPGRYCSPSHRMS